MSENKFTNWLHKELKLQQQEKEKAMARAVKRDGAMILDEAQKKLILDVFNAGREFNDDYRESGFKYMRVWTVEQLMDLIDDMKDAFGIVPKKSSEKDFNGEIGSPMFWTDHVWSDDSRAWKRKD
tara:strand:- start:1062 stop:1436 length:375 start_codon:yes stop_codon:yes gene_type:complete